MSGTLNKVMLIGHLGDEVKLHYFEGGNCIGRFPIATNETYTNRQTGEKARPRRSVKNISARAILFI
jgi:single-strand DNA-binding protein